MKELKTEIEIASTTQDVWNKITDFSNWHTWNPIVYRLNGELKPQAKLNFIMSNSKGEKGKRYDASITKINDNSFTYTATMMSKSLFCAERIIEIEEQTDKSVIFKQKEKYSGILTGLFWKKLKEDALPMIESMNKALKQELEK